MVKRKSTCGLCKPEKKWKQTDTKVKQRLRKETEIELSIVLQKQNIGIIRL